MFIKLPAHDKRDEIVEVVRHSQVTVISGPTGSGKTTQVPLFLLEEGFATNGQIGVTEPRRVAAMSVSRFVAQLHSTDLGDSIGYQIRHINETSSATSVKFMTEGILLRELQADRHLRKYSVIILDEVHERGLNQDILMALLKDTLALRNDLKLVIMSATINEGVFADYFNALVVKIEGRTHPVTPVYLGAEKDYVYQSVGAVGRALTETSGDVLVFMPDFRSIKSTASRIEMRHPDVHVHMLYGNQSPDEQRAVFDRTGRSVIIATNIAETSITLEGVTAVVDTGLIKQMSYHARQTLSSLQVVPHSQAGCEQRMGRAGRTQPGVCYRLYTEENLEAREPFTQPEILRSSLCEVLLQLKRMGFDDGEIRNMDFLNAPYKAYWQEAGEQLQLLGALSGTNELTKDGLFMSELPLPPSVSRMILSAADYGCVLPVVTIAAMFSTRPLFIRPRDEEESADRAHEQFQAKHSDFLTALKAINAWRLSADREEFARTNYLHYEALLEICAVEEQIVGILIENNIPLSKRRGPEEIAKSVASGLLANFLTKDGGSSYHNRHQSGIKIFPGSALRRAKITPEFMVTSEVVETQQMYARTCQALRPEWIPELIPNSADLAHVDGIKYLTGLAKRLKRKANKRGKGGQRGRKPEYRNDKGRSRRR